MQKIFSQLTKDKKILIVLSFLYEMMVFVSWYSYTEDNSLLMLAIFSLPIVLLWSSIWIWGWWMFCSYTKFLLYLLCSIFLFGLSSYVKPYEDILSAILKSLAVFCSVIACIIWKKMPSSKEKEKGKGEGKREKQSHLGILLVCIFFIVGGTFLGKYSAPKMNQMENNTLEDTEWQDVKTPTQGIETLSPGYTDLGTTQYQMEKKLTKQCKTSQNIPEIIKPYFCPCFVQLITDIIKEHEKDFVEKIKQIAMQNGINDLPKEGFAYGMKYMNDKLQNDPIIQSKMQRCVDISIEQIQKNIQGN